MNESRRAQQRYRICSSPGHGHRAGAKTGWTRKEACSSNSGLENLPNHHYNATYSRCKIGGSRLPVIEGDLR